MKIMADVWTDATRKRRTSDEPRRKWYAKWRQIRFAKR